MKSGVRKSFISPRFFWPTKIGIEYQYTKLIFDAKRSPANAIFALHQTAADYCVTKTNSAQLLHASFYMNISFHPFGTKNEAKNSSTL